ncbi:hypothetical protein AB9P05_24835 [Roseivirga sp. BDSF3-8]|uniref:hypothetical protein n=1 Tax=Roseivirga sp. BDSF3-8 TaxID=3241598 RepID=UPI0035324CDA
MTQALEGVALHDAFLKNVENLKKGLPAARQQYITKILGQVSALAATEQGLSFLYDHIDEVIKAGFFLNSPWEDKDKLNPALVPGTLKSGEPNLSMELLNELRMLKWASEGDDDALDFVEHALVQSIDLVFQDFSEETRMAIGDASILRIRNLFNFILQKISLTGLLPMLTEELKLMAAQRPVVTRPIRDLIRLIHDRMPDSKEMQQDEKLGLFIRAVYHPVSGFDLPESYEEFEQVLSTLADDKLEAMARDFAYCLRETGLGNPHHAVFLEYAAKHKPALVPLSLGLDATGTAEFEKHRQFVCKLFGDIIDVPTAQAIFGLALTLENGLLSRQPVINGIQRLFSLKVHPEVDKILLRSRHGEKKINSRKLIIAAVFRILGQPLGVGQGNNPTCQAARGISMWSRHAPGKLLNMILTVAEHNNLEYMFEGKLLRSASLGEGLVGEIDLNLDPVSIVLVPHLDKVYNEMMRMAVLRGEDPHKFVNPALYGQWIHTGFKGVLDPLTQTIKDYPEFVRIFYNSFHPDYNGGHDMLYPNPVGIFITSSGGKLLGFHAVSMLRVSKFENGGVRVYFLNPNNEGRQNWGQGIKPTVFGFGEQPGESSLPFEQFLARVYAFHYNSIAYEAIEDDEVRKKLINKVEKLSRESWGKSYNWAL